MLRKHLAAREVLVQTRSRMISLRRSLLRQEGVRVPSGGAPTFPQRVRALDLSEDLAFAVEPLLKTHEQVCEQIKQGAELGIWREDACVEHEVLAGLGDLRGEALRRSISSMGSKRRC